MWKYFTPVPMVGHPVSHLDSNITSYKHLPPCIISRCKPLKCLWTSSHCKIEPNTVLAYSLINPAAGSTLFPADPFVITRIQIACVDENGPVVVMSGVLRFEIFRMTRSITHVKFSMKQRNFWATRNPAHSIWRGRVARVADESGAAASKPPPECSWPPPSPAKFR